MDGTFQAPAGHDDVRATVGAKDIVEAARVKAIGGAGFQRGVGVKDRQHRVWQCGLLKDAERRPAPDRRARRSRQGDDEPTAGTDCPGYLAQTGVPLVAVGDRRPPLAVYAGATAGSGLTGASVVFTTRPQLPSRSR